MLLMKHEAKFFTISPGISGDCQHNANLVKLEPNIDGDEGMLHICRYSVFLRFQNMKVYVILPFKLLLGERDKCLFHLNSFEKKNVIVNNNPRLFSLLKHNIL